MTVSPLDSLDERIRRAIAEKRLLEIRYKRAVRLAEPHDYGVIDGTERLLIFQLHGPDSGKGAVGWRLLDVVKIESCVESDLRREPWPITPAALPMGDAVRARDVGRPRCPRFATHTSDRAGEDSALGARKSAGANSSRSPRRSLPALSTPAQFSIETTTGREGTGVLPTFTPTSSIT